jgi:hypothetical protein
LGILTDRNQPGALQDLQVLRDRGLTDRERPRDLGHRGLAARKAGKNGAPRRVGEREKRGIEAI